LMLQVSHHDVKPQTRSELPEARLRQQVHDQTCLRRTGKLRARSGLIEGVKGQGTRPFILRQSVLRKTEGKA
jgi:hypothetical protein